jgi:hypothetical protein
MPSKRPAAPAPEPAKRIVRKRPAEPRPPVDEDYEPDEEDAPPPNGHQPPTKKAPVLRGGRTEAQRQADAASSYAKSFRPTNKTEVIKFLEEVPYVVYRRHWVKSTGQDGRETNRPYVCPQSYDDPETGRPMGCPLCDVGDKSQYVASYNIAICGDDGQVLHRSWDMGIRVYKAVDGYSTDPKIAPLTRNFYLVSKSGEGTSTQYNVSPVRASALEEDYDTPVPDQSEFDRIELYTPAIVTVDPPKKLRELAHELTAEY